MLFQLHTLEDFAAHSNFCELALASLGHNNVFLHVGDQVRIQASNGNWVAPLVTGECYIRSSAALYSLYAGTFGSQDFIHSLLGGEPSIIKGDFCDADAMLQRLPIIS